MANKYVGLNNKNLSIFLIFLSIMLYGIICFYALTKPAILFDDYYSLGIVIYSFRDMIFATASNVHPPLYYIIFKIFKVLLHPNSNFYLIIIGKIVSLVPLGLLLIFSCTKIRKEFNLLVSGIFCLLLCSSFQIMNYSTVIRMYSWGLFFLTIQLFYTYDLLRNGKNKSWIIFTVAAICSSYTHYFCAISSILIYGLILLYFLMYNRNQIKKWAISSAVCIIAYLPWLNILLTQISSVRENYWIKPITMENILEYFQFIFSPNNNEIGLVIGFILLITIIAVTFLAFKRENIVLEEKAYILILLSTIFLTIFAGIVLSLLIRPIFVERYILPCFGGLWLGFSIIISKFKEDKRILYALIAFLLVISAVGTLGFIDESNIAFEDSNKNLDFLNSINENYDFVVMEDPLTYLRYSPFLPNVTVVNGDINATIASNSNQENIIVFDKLHHVENNTNFTLIGEIHQDKVYIFKS
jgi:hypothetical protein